MSNIVLAAGTDSGYSIARSVRVRNSASAYFNRTPASASNRQTWTYSGWLKRGILTTRMALLEGFTGTTNGTLRTGILILDGGALQIGSDQMQTATDFVLDTTQVFRDPSAWYHIVVAFDTTQATSTNRVKLYVNGVQVTAFSTATYPSLNYQGGINFTNNQYINRWFDSAGGNYYGDGYLTEINFIDGQALTPSSFGEIDAVTGVWTAKKYSGAYGTNGFYLNFSDNSAATAAAIGKDYSGNGNNWTPNNISVTSGVTYDSMVDSPTVGSLSSNYATWNPLDINAGLSTANGNLSVGTGGTTSAHRLARSTIGFTTKTYFEITTSGGSTGMVCMIGAGQATANPADGTYVGGYGKSFGLGYATTSSNFYLSGVSLANGSATNLVDGTWAFAVDPANGKAWVRNTSGSWIGGGDPATDTSPTLTWTSDGLPWFPATSFYNITNTYSVVLNCGQRPFSYTPPTGFVALNTQNLPDSTIKKGASYFNAVTWSGTGSNQQVPLAFTPDFVWAKRRNGADGHRLYDVPRGVGKNLTTNATDAEATDTYGLDFDNGNYLDITGAGYFGTSGNTFVGWNWKESASAGFDIVTWTGNGTARTISHNLGVTPSMFITKRRDAASSWRVFHNKASATPQNGCMFLEGTQAFTTTTIFNSTAPTSTTFSVGTDPDVNANGGTYIAYLFSEVAGYSKFGSYTGNGSADGTFVYTGFRPRWVIIKSTGVEDWIVHDTSRNPYNASNLVLYPNSSQAEDNNPTYRLIDILSNGFKMRSNQGQENGSGTTYIYAAFAENPFKNSLAR